MKQCEAILSDLNFQSPDNKQQTWQRLRSSKQDCLSLKNNLCSALAIFIFWTHNSMNNLLSYFGLVDTKIRASDDKDIPVLFH